MQNRISTMVLVMSALGVSNALALTGHDVMRMCKAEQDGCYWYLSGIGDSYDALRARTEITPTICMPDTLTPADLSEAFQAYLNDRLQHWHFEAGGLALNAFQKAWPCTR